MLTRNTASSAQIESPTIPKTRPAVTRPWIPSFFFIHCAAKMIASIEKINESPVENERIPTIPRTREAIESPVFDVSYSSIML